jgi:hypothetical protein
MKQKKFQMARWFFTGLSITAFVLSACKMPLGGYWEYTFENQTSYSITVSLNRAYKLVKEETWADKKPWLDDDLDIYSRSSKTVYIEEDSVDFEWTASSQSYNRYIYPVKAGSKVTFREREK